MKKEAEFMHKDLPVYAFATEQDFDTWMSENYHRKEGFWLRFYKKTTGIPTIQVGDAVNVALCWGWIDGLINAHDDKSYLVRFTPRRPKSVWSQVNVAKVEKLIQEGRMQPSGLVHIESAKLDGRWAMAYSSKKES